MVVFRNCRTSHNKRVCGSLTLTQTLTGFAYRKALSEMPAVALKRFKIENEIK